MSKRVHGPEGPTGKEQAVIYLGDNCGEIVFDKLLIETIKAHYEIDVAFVVRSIPALNDATTREAELIGMGDVASIVENGIDGPLPGTVSLRCSERLGRCGQVLIWSL